MLDPTVSPVSLAPQKKNIVLDCVLERPTPTVTVTWKKPLNILLFQGVTLKHTGTTGTIGTTGTDPIG